MALTSAQYAVADNSLVTIVLNGVTMTLPASGGSGPAWEQYTSWLAANNTPSAYVAPPTFTPVTLSLSNTISIGSNVTGNTEGFMIGNSTVNAVINSTSMKVSGTATATDMVLTNLSATGLAAGFINQAVKTTSSPTFAQVSITGLGALSGTILNQGVLTTSSPTFAEVNITGLGGLKTSFLNQAVKTTSGVTFATLVINSAAATLSQWIPNSSQGICIQAGPGTVNAYYLANMLETDGTQAGSIHCSSASTTYNTTSDARVKENIKAISIGLDELLKIDVREFNFITDESKTVRHGMIAQELHKVYPNAVHIPLDGNGEIFEDINPETGRPRRPWSVDYSKLVPLTIRSVQQLKEENDELRQIIKDLQKRVTLLEKKNG